MSFTNTCLKKAEVSNMSLYVSQCQYRMETYKGDEIYERICKA